MYVCTCIYVYIHILYCKVYVYTYVYVSIQMYMYICVYVSIHMYMYICVYVCVYMYAHVHAYIHAYLIQIITHAYAWVRDSFMCTHIFVTQVYTVRDSCIWVCSWHIYMYMHVCMCVPQSLWLIYWLRYTQFVTHLYEYVRDTFICIYVWYSYIRDSRTVYDSFRCIWPWLIFMYMYTWICISQSSWLIYMYMYNMCMRNSCVRSWWVVSINMFVTHWHVHIYVYVSHKVRDSSIYICIICVCVTHVYAVGESFRFICSWLIDMYTYMYTYLTKFVTHSYVYV